MEPLIISLKPATIAYLLAKPHLLNSCQDYGFSDNSIFFTPKDIQQQNTITRLIKQLDNVVNCQVIPTFLAQQDFVKRTYTIYKGKLSHKSNQMIILHEQELIGAMATLTDKITSNAGLKWIEDMGKQLTSESRLPNRKYLYVLLYQQNIKNDQQARQKLLNDVVKCFGPQLTISSRSGVNKQLLFNEELPSISTEIFMMLVKQTPYFEQQLESISISKDKKRVIMVPKYFDNLMKLYKLDKIYSLQNIQSGESACQQISKVMTSLEWKKLKKTYLEIKLITSKSFEVIIEETIKKFPNKDLIDSLGPLVQQLKQNPYEVYLFCKTPAIKSCTRIFKNYYKPTQQEIAHSALNSTQQHHGALQSLSSHDSDQYEYWLIKIKKATYRYLKQEDVEKPIDIQQKYGVMLQLLQSTRINSKEELKYNPQLVYRRIKHQQRKRNRTESKPYEFLIYTHCTKYVRDLLQSEFDVIEESLPQSDYNILQQNQNHDKANISDGDISSVAFFGSEDKQEAIIHHKQEEPNNSERDILQQIPNDSFDLQSDTKSISIADNQCIFEAIDQSEVNKHIKHQITKEFPLMELNKQCFDRYSKLATKMKSVIKKMGNSIEASGSEDFFQKLAQQLRKDIKQQRKIEQLKKLQCVTQLNSDDDTLINSLLGQKLIECSKLHNPAHIRQWELLIVHHILTNSKVCIVDTYLSVNEDWMKDIMRTGGFKSLMGENHIETFTDLKEIRKRTHPSHYVVICRTIRCGTCLDSKFTEDKKAKSMRYFKPNYVLPVYVGKLKYD